jgi:rubredoxin
VSGREVDRWFASSKTCSACGVVYADLVLGGAAWTCAACGAEHDRDEPPGQRIEDKVRFAQEILRLYGGLQCPI